jgi:hypothetical protein
MAPILYPGTKTFDIRAHVKFCFGRLERESAAAAGSNRHQPSGRRAWKNLLMLGRLGTGGGLFQLPHTTLLLSQPS